MYKMVIDISSEARVLIFRGPGCRKRMMNWYDDYHGKAAECEEIKRIRVWGTVGNKTNLVLEWVCGLAPGSEDFFRHSPHLG